MDFNELENYLQSIPERIMDNAPQKVADIATEYYKDRFREKSFDGNPWAPLKVPKKTGSLLIESGKLQNSVRPEYVGRDKVVISAGNDKVNYARVHNEGYTGPVVVPSHVRHTRKYGNVNVKEHSRQASIPQRQFMGKSEELADKIHDNLQEYTNSLK